MHERMSDTEAIMWAVEKDPALRSDFVNITLLDQPPDLARLRAKVREGIEGLPRLGQRVVSPPLRLAPPEWVDDPSFDLDYHVRRLAVPAPGTQRQFLDLAATLASTPFDRARPLWEFTVVEGLEGGGAALLQRVHHTIIDGVGGVRFSMMLLDLERDPEPPEPAADISPARKAADEVAAIDEARRRSDPLSRTSPLDVITGALGHSASRATGAVRGAANFIGQLLRHPEVAPVLAEEAVRAIGSIRRQVLVPGSSLSTVMTQRSLGRKYELFSIPLSKAKATASALGGTVNDVFVTGVAGALGLYHERMGAPVEELRMAMPVSMRSGESSDGNQFAPSRVVVPVVPKDPAERFQLIHERLSSVRSEPALALASQLAGALGLLPTSVLVTATRAQVRTIDFATSNLRGAAFELFIAGARIEANHPMGPTTGCAVNVTVLSYRDQLDMGLNIDPAAITDVPAFTDCMTESFDTLLAVH